MVLRRMFHKHIVTFHLSCKWTLKDLLSSIAHPPVIRSSFQKSCQITVKLNATLGDKEDRLISAPSYNIFFKLHLKTDIKLVHHFRASDNLGAAGKRWHESFQTEPRTPLSEESPAGTLVKQMVCNETRCSYMISNAALSCHPSPMIILPRIWARSFLLLPFRFVTSWVVRGASNKCWCRVSFQLWECQIIECRCFICRWMGWTVSRIILFVCGKCMNKRHLPWSFGNCVKFKDE